MSLNLQGLGSHGHTNLKSNCLQNLSILDDSCDLQTVANGAKEAPEAEEMIKLVLSRRRGNILFSNHSLQPLTFKQEEALWHVADSEVTASVGAWALPLGG